jgi:hypothetical protein
MRNLKSDIYNIGETDESLKAQINEVAEAYQNLYKLWREKHPLLNATKPSDRGKTDPWNLDTDVKRLSEYMNYKGGLVFKRSVAKHEGKMKYYYSDVYRVIAASKLPKVWLRRLSEKELSTQESIDKISELKSLIDLEKTIVTDEILKLKAQIASNKGDMDYLSSGYHADDKMLKEFQSQLKELEEVEKVIATFEEEAEKRSEVIKYQPHFDESFKDIIKYFDSPSNPTGWRKKKFIPVEETDSSCESVLEAILSTL